MRKADKWDRRREEWRSRLMENYSDSLSMQDISNIATDIAAVLRRVARAPRKPITGEELRVAWEKYVAVFGVPPHGTLKQMNALACLLPKAAPAQTSTGGA